ncbi:WXG100 family type VII secretion target [Mycobacteroides abscessus subsp. massiliense]|uniref:type VII secretion target n=1 Tax=Mycobacteroides abscessus TaxID=36809 RepID=UPI0009A6A91A|nr:type VII secretion target [Mycobacteroides abscessus]SKD36815.1 WXG100 family type VII secretion target [Mycobacteroides abscessus subsp. massiliense]SKD37077.1 WXG100 family type VII secretion target [Mycobacteroides abscessus subsp. massiliense]SKD46703.1 WXG100 family type VII secretion target [Mycobacteroides abscessus subsp. massiliense]SKD49163.1 WXG100 family type VII secretion target [Mycobacteroides abscessus subsp. massiliense]SKD58399.1 WXG100 family type VII secretion target [My
MALQINPEDVNRHAWALIDAVTDSRADHAHDVDSIAEAAGGWIGESARALNEVQGVWSDQGDVLHRNLGGLGTWMQEAASRFTAQDQRSRDSIAKTDGGQ